MARKERGNATQANGGATLARASALQDTSTTGVAEIPEGVDAKVAVRAQQSRRGTAYAAGWSEVWHAAMTHEHGLANRIRGRERSQAALRSMTEPNHGSSVAQESILWDEGG